MNDIYNLPKQQCRVRHKCQFSATLSHSTTKEAPMAETIFSKAADLIHEHGWVQVIDGRDTHSGPKAECIYLAIGKARRQMGLTLQEEYAAVDALATHLGVKGVREITRWNDAPERTVEDVFLVLKELHVKAIS